MKKLATGLFAALAAVTAFGFAALSSMTYQQAEAASASVGAFADDALGLAGATGAASSTGGSGSSSGLVALCPNFIAVGGSCSEAE